MLHVNFLACATFLRVPFKIYTIMNICLPPRSHPHTKLSAEENKQLTAGPNWPSPKLEASCSEKATFHPQSTAELSLVFRSPCCSTVPCNRTYQNHSHPRSPIQMIFFLCTAFNHFRPTTAVSHRIKSIHLLYHLV